MENMNKITKNSTLQNDYTILKDATDAYNKAYYNSKSILSGCAVGQATKAFDNAINSEMKVSEKLSNINKKLEQKYQFYPDGNIPISDIPEIFNKQMNVGIVDKRAEFFAEAEKASQNYTSLPAYKEGMVKLLASYDDPEDNFDFTEYATQFLTNTPEYLKIEELKEYRIKEGF